MGDWSKMAEEDVELTSSHKYIKKKKLHLHVEQVSENIYIKLAENLIQPKLYHSTALPLSKLTQPEAHSDSL